MRRRGFYELLQGWKEDESDEGGGPVGVGENGLLMVGPIGGRRRVRVDVGKCFEAGLRESVELAGAIADV